MKASIFSADLQELLGLLAKHQVRYLLVGGQAVIYHGYPRLTGDVDVFYERTAANTARLFAALEAFWGGDVPELGGPEELMEADLVVQFGRPPNRVDLLASISGVTFEEAWRSRSEVPLEGTPHPMDVPMIGLDCLLENKRSTGRLKDLADVEFLVRLHQHE
ncbi:MAG: DUF6036 family nucleotidyltransferase [Myxococcota bacterium]